MKHALISISLLALLTVGCHLGKQPESPRRYYMLETQRQEPAHPTVFKTNLAVQPFHLAPGFNETDMLYRIGYSQYESDYYHQFIVDIRKQLTEQTRQWLADSGCFQYVVSAASKAGTSYTLEGNIIKIYGDFQDKKNPKAVLKLEFYLIDTQSHQQKIVFNQGYKVETPLSDNSIDALIKGYNQSLATILKQLEKDIVQINISN